MQGEISTVFSQGRPPQCTVDCFPSRVWHKALLQEFLTLYYKGIFRALLLKGWGGSLHLLLSLSGNRSPHPPSPQRFTNLWRKRTIMRGCLQCAWMRKSLSSRTAQHIKHQTTHTLRTLSAHNTFEARFSEWTQHTQWGSLTKHDHTQYAHHKLHSLLKQPTTHNLSNTATHKSQPHMPDAHHTYNTYKATCKTHTNQKKRTPNWCNAHFTHYTRHSKHTWNIQPAEPHRMRNAKHTTYAQSISVITHN